MADFVFPDVIETAPTATASGSDFVFPDVIETTPRQSNSVGSKLSSIFSALSETGSGAVEGVSGLAGFLADNLSISPSKGNIGTILAAKAREALGGEPAAEALQRAPDGASQQLQSITDAVLPEADPDYRYARRFGQFVGPTVATGGTSPAAILSALTGSAAGQATEDAGGNQWAQLAASIFGGAAPGTIKSIWGAGRNALKGATEEEILGTAAKIQKTNAGLTQQEIAAAREIAGKDPLGLAQLRTTAEITGNGGMAQIEKAMADRPEFVNRYNTAQTLRSDARDAIINNMTESKGMTRAALGEEVIDAAKANFAGMGKTEKDLFTALPKATGSLESTQAGILDDLVTLTEGRPYENAVGAETRKLIKDILEPIPTANTTGGIQRLRSDAGKLLRNFNSPKTPADEIILGNIQKNLLQANEEAFGSVAAKDYAAARAATKLKKSIFDNSDYKTTGEKLLEPGLDPANALKTFTGTKRSAEQLATATGLNKNPELRDKINRSLLEAMRGKPDEALTAAKAENFLIKNEEGLNVLLGKKHVGDVKAIIKDVKSQDGVSKLAFSSSKGNSVTGQKQTVAGAIQSAIDGGVGPMGTMASNVVAGAIPGSSAVSKVVGSIKAEIGNNAGLKVSEYLFEAAMNPKFAEQLAMTPTTVRVMNWVQRFGEWVKNTKETALKVGAIDTLRPEPEAQKTPKAPAAAAPAPAPKADAVAPISAATEDAGFTAALKAIGFVESRGNKNAVSPKGAIGTHQVMPIAMRDVMRAKGVNDKIYSDAQLRKMAAEEGASEYYGTEYVKLLYDRFNGDWPLVFAAYNGGPSLVKKLLKDSGGDSFDDIKSRLPSETRNYVPAVQAALSRITKA